MVHLALLTPKDRQIVIAWLVPQLDGLCETGAFSSAHKEHLHAQRNQTNQWRLRQSYYEYVEAIFWLPKTVPGVSLLLEQPIQFQKIEDVPVTFIYEATIPLMQHFLLSHYGTPTFGDEAISCTMPSGRSPGLPQLTAQSWHGIMHHNN